MALHLSNASAFTPPRVVLNGAKQAPLSSKSRHQVLHSVLSVTASVGSLAAGSCDVTGGAAAFDAAGCGALALLSRFLAPSVTARPLPFTSGVSEWVQVTMPLYLSGTTSANCTCPFSSIQRQIEVASAGTEMTKNATIANPLKQKECCRSQAALPIFRVFTMFPLSIQPPPAQRLVRAALRAVAPLPPLLSDQA